MGNKYNLAVASANIHTIKIYNINILNEYLLLTPLMYKEAANTHVPNDTESKLAEPSWNRLIGIINTAIAIKGAGYSNNGI